MTPEPDYAGVFTAFPVPALVVDEDATILTVNDRLLTLSGRSAEELIGRGIEALIADPEPDPTDARRIRQAITRATEVGEPDAVAAIRHRQLDPGGREELRFWSVSTAPVAGPGRPGDQAIVRIEDITDALLETSPDRPPHPLRRRSDAPQGAILIRARHLQELSRRLEARDEAGASGSQSARQPDEESMDRFLASLAHELRNPLAAIRGALDVLAGVPSAETNSLLAVIDRQVQALTRITDDVLEVTRARVGKMTIEPRRLELGALAASAVESLRASGTLADQAVELSIRGRLWIVGDPVRLTQALNNLLGNAVKFTRPDGRIRVTVERTGDWATVTLGDDGIGFAPERAGQLFEPFSQESELPQPRAGGLGLGLAIAKTIVELHGGEITATSDGPDQGATFAVRVPLESAAPGLIATAQSASDEPQDGEAASPSTPQPQPDALVPPATPPDRPPPGDPPRPEDPPPVDPLDEDLAPLSVLVIEDAEDVAAAFRAQLERLGHRVEVAGSAAVGIHQAMRREWDVILCDIGLPDLSGYEVAHYLRTEHSIDDLPLIAITGYGRDSDRARAMTAGFDDFLVKPVAGRELVEAVEAAARGLDEQRR